MLATFTGRAALFILLQGSLAICLLFALRFINVVLCARHDASFQA
jgi:hypothetical protein